MLRVLNDASINVVIRVSILQIKLNINRPKLHKLNYSYFFFALTSILYFS